jgi:hypothetical protein
VPLKLSLNHTSNISAAGLRDRVVPDRTFWSFEPDIFLEAGIRGRRASRELVEWNFSEPVNRVPVYLEKDNGGFNLYAARTPQAHRPIVRESSKGWSRQAVRRSRPDGTDEPRVSGISLNLSMRNYTYVSLKGSRRPNTLPPISSVPSSWRISSSEPSL